MIVKEMKISLIRGEDEYDDKTEDRVKTILHLVAADGNYDIVSYLIRKGYKIDARDNMGNTPLHYAIINGQFNVAKLLILKGADINSTNKKGQTPLHMTSISIPVNSRLIPSIFPIKGRISSKFGIRRSPFTGIYQFHYGIDIAAPLKNPVYATADGRVIKTGWNGNLGKMVQVRHSYGYSSIYGHNYKIFARYYKKIRKGDVIANVGLTGSTTGSHCHYSIKYYGIPINPYHFMHGNNRKKLANIIQNITNIIGLLKQNGADFNKRDIYGRTPLHYAVIRNLQVTRTLINMGANINIRDYHGMSPLHFSASINLGITKHLLRRGAYVNSRTTTKYKTENGLYIKKRTTPLGIALKKEWLAMARLIIRYGGKE
jgi:ankyrin repeat protein